MRKAYVVKAITGLRLHAGSQRFVEGTLADRNYLDEFLFGIEQDYSKRFVRKKTHFRTKLRDR